MREPELRSRIRDLLSSGRLPRQLPAAAQMDPKLIVASPSIGRPGDGALRGLRRGPGHGELHVSRRPSHSDAFGLRQRLARGAGATVGSWPPRCGRSGCVGWSRC